MTTARLTSKCQVTIPKEIRKAAGLRPGDTVAYQIAKKGAVILRRVDPLDAAFHAALASTLEEWTSTEDEEAFRDL